MKSQKKSTQSVMAELDTLLKRLFFIINRQKSLIQSLGPFEFYRQNLS
jgi:hypothetical protein